RRRWQRGPPHGVAAGRLRRRAAGRDPASPRGWRRGAAPGLMTAPTTWVATRPQLGDAEAVAVLRERWGVAGRVEALPSERDRNLLVVPRDGGPRLVLKIANLAEDRAFLACQLEAMSRLADAGVPVATVVPAADGATIIGLGDGGGPPLARVVT